MTVTGWLVPRWDAVWWSNVTFSGITDAGWLERELLKQHTRARLGIPSVNDANALSVALRTGIPGMTSDWRCQFRWSRFRAPVAPAGAYAVEWRIVWTVANRTMVPPRCYWDHVGIVGAPLNGQTNYTRWPWKRGWAEHLWTFGDPRTWRTTLWAEMSTYLNISATKANLRARFYY